MVQPLFHIARAADWAQARAAGAYRISTLGRTLEQQGYIHLSYARQVNRVADAFYRDVEGGLVLLAIDPQRLTAPVVVEPGAGSGEQFPHLYGELPVSAVLAAHAYAPVDGDEFPPVAIANRTMPTSVVIPQLVYDDVDAAVRWLCEAFGFTARWQAGDHRAQLAIPNGGCVVVTERHGSQVLPGHNSVLVRITDLDAHCEHARAFGATILEPPQDHPYGERQYAAEDLGGHHWAFSESIADVPPADWGATPGPALTG